MVNHLAKSPTLRSDLFLSLGSEENDKMKNAFQRTVAVLEKRAPTTLRWQAQLTRGADHSDNVNLATPVAPRRAYANWPTTMRTPAATASSTP